MKPYPAGLPDSVAVKWNTRINNFFKLFLKHKNRIIRVTLWKMTNKQTWRNNCPIPGRTDYPLLFDRNYKSKPVVETFIKEATPNP